MTSYPLAPCLPKLRNVLKEVRKLAQEKCYNIGTFCDAVWSFLAVLCDTPGGEALLTECGEFVLRNTADGTAYAHAWKKGSERISELATGLEPAAEPQKVRMLELEKKAVKVEGVDFYSLPDIATEVFSGPVRELRAVAQQVEWVWQLEPVRDSPDAIITGGGLAEDVRMDLKSWWSAAIKVIGPGQECRADGCRLLLEMHLHGLESVQVAVLKVQKLGSASAGLILESAEFLADPSSYENGSQQQGHVADKEKRYCPPPCPKCGLKNKVGVQHTATGEYRNLRCGACEHTWKEPWR